MDLVLDVLLLFVVTDHCKHVNVGFTDDLHLFLALALDVASNAYQPGLALFVDYHLKLEKLKALVTQHVLGIEDGVGLDEVVVEAEECPHDHIVHLGQNFFSFHSLLF